MLYRAARGGSRADWTAWAGFTLTCLFSAGSLYLLVLRHQRSPTLAAYWEPFYPSTTSLQSLLTWLMACPVEIGQYGSNGLGIPLTVLGMAGAVLLGKRSVLRLLLLAGPLALAMTASLLHCYPLEDRLTFFLVPCLYLLAAETAGALAVAACAAGRTARLSWFCWVGLTTLLLAGVGPMVERLAFEREPGLRDAFDYAHCRANAGDVYWVSHPEVFEVYYRNRETCLGSYDPAAEVTNRARGRRIWLISAGVDTENLEQRLRAAGHVLTHAHRVRHNITLLYAPPGQTDDWVRK